MKDFLFLRDFSFETCYIVCFYESLRSFWFIYGRVRSGEGDVCQGGHPFRNCVGWKREVYAYLLCWLI